MSFERDDRKLSSGAPGRTAAEPVGRRTLAMGLPDRDADHDRPAVPGAGGPGGDGAAADPGAGAALPDDLRRRAGAVLGADLSGVRVHAGAASAASAEAIGARAYAVDQDIHFARGAYQPGTPEGDHLLAHEVVHTVQQRGAPSLQGKREIGDAGDAAEAEADTLAAAIVAGDARRASVTARPSGRIQRTPHVMRPDAARPERTPVQITGRYEALDPGGSNRITLQLNQAGTHFEGWWQRRVQRFASGAHMEHRRIVGDVTASAPDRITFQYQRFRDGGTPVAGTMVATPSSGSVSLQLTEGSGAVTVSPDGHLDIDTWNHEFRRTSEAPRLSDAGIESLPSEARPAARAAEDAPLDSDEERRLRSSAELIMARIREWFGASHGVPRDAYAGGVDHLVETTYSYFAAEQHLLVTQRLHEMLVGPRFTGGSITRPYWDWLAVIVASSPTYTTHLQSRLGIPASGVAAAAGAPQNEYSWSFDVVGLAGDVGVGLGGFLGRFRIEQTAGAATWSTTYFTVLGQVSGGPSAGVTVGMHTSNTFQSPFPWRSGNFRGAYTITGAAAGGAPIVGGTGGAGFINFMGDGAFPPVSGDAGGLTVIVGLYIGAEVSQAGGYLFGGREEAIAYARAHAPRTVSGTYTAGAAAHFAVDDPSLTAAGLAALRQTCAQQRAMLTNASGSITINGYASPAGEAEHNRTLSNLRARNTLQAIRDIMGSDLHIPPERQSYQGLGEAPARAAGVADGQESDAWRKVEVAFNGTVVLTLHY